MHAPGRRATSITTLRPGYPAAVPCSRATGCTLLATLIATLGLGAGLPAGASAATTSKNGASTARQSSFVKKRTTRATLRDDLWATVNICDTREHPDTIGIRGSMPGSGRSRERMYMRFQLQFFDQREKEWRDTGASGDSGFVPVGPAARRKARESGRNFTVRPPRTGAFYLRGSVTFEWRRGKKVVRRHHRRTSSKHPRTAGADPAAFSARKCILRA